MRSNDSFNFPLGLIKYILIVTPFIKDLLFLPEPNQFCRRCCCCLSFDVVVGCCCVFVLFVCCLGGGGGYLVGLFVVFVDNAKQKAEGLSKM